MVSATLKAALGAVGESEQGPVDVGPLTPFAWITREPRQPKITVNVQLPPGCVMVGEMSYEAVIRYTDHGRNDESLMIAGKSGTGQVVLDFGDEIQGGVARFTATATLQDADGQTIPGSSVFTAEVRGQNPSKESVKARLPSLPLQVIAFLESAESFGQFTSQGWPLFNEPHGFGVMQLDPPPSARHIWDWKANVDAGIDVYREKEGHARGYVTTTRKKNPEARELSDDELKMEIYQRYNGGAYWHWDKDAKDWIARPKNEYANRCLEIENAVTSGVAPAGWD